MAEPEAACERRSEGLSAVLRSEHRREALAIVQDAGCSIALVDLAQDLCLDGGASPSTNAEFEAIEQCYVGLYHLDVPKLADAGLVKFDSDRRSVAPAE